MISLKNNKLTAPDFIFHLHHTLLILIACFLCVGPSKVNAQDITGFTTDLPLIIIDTEGRTIVDEPKVRARMKIINNNNGINRYSDIPTDYNGFIGIEKRGSTSQSYPQTPYGLETQDSNGENLNVSLLGLPKENDWVLLSNYNDKTFMRNILAYKMFESLGNYAPRARLVEVILNNEYKGIYVFGEKIKRDKNRVNIAELSMDDTTGDDITGGYIFKVDYYNSYDSWVSNYHPPGFPSFDVHFVYHDPDWDELTNRQKSYLRNHVDAFEQALYAHSYDNPATGYQNFIDVNSFIDYFIVNEISRNNDGFKKSRFFHKDRNGKIVAGPVWDFDWAFKNINECYIFKATDGSGWAYQINNCNPGVKSPGWMIRLFEDPVFRDQTNCRYMNARATVLSDERLFGMIDSLAAVVQNAQERHFNKWPILGKNVGAPEIGEHPLTYQGETEKLKQWIETRLNWLDKNMKGSCATTGVNIVANDPEFRMYPNPTVRELTIEGESVIEKIELYNSSGERVMALTSVNTNRMQLDVSNLQPGIYAVRLLNKNGGLTVEKIMIK